MPGGGRDEAELKAVADLIAEAYLERATRRSPREARGSRRNRAGLTGGLSFNWSVVPIWR